MKTGVSLKFFLPETGVDWPNFVWTQTNFIESRSFPFLNSFNLLDLNWLEQVLQVATMISTANYKIIILNHPVEALR